MKAVALGAGLILTVVALIWMTMDISAGGDKKDEKGVITTKSGLKYIERKVGIGREAKAGNTVAVHYTGTFTSGKQFDSSLGKDPIEFPLGRGCVIPGWDEGIAGMKEGGKRTLIIPSDLAYGPQGRDGIPPNSELHFEVELIQVK